MSKINILMRLPLMLSSLLAAPVSAQQACSLTEQHSPADCVCTPVDADATASCPVNVECPSALRSLRIERMEVLNTETSYRPFWRFGLAQNNPSNRETDSYHSGGEFHFLVRSVKPDGHCDSDSANFFNTGGVTCTVGFTATPRFRSNSGDLEISWRVSGTDATDDVDVSPADFDQDQDGNPDTQFPSGVAHGFTSAGRSTPTFGAFSLFFLNDDLFEAVESFQITVSARDTQVTRDTSGTCTGFITHRFLRDTFNDGILVHTIEASGSGRALSLSGPTTVAEGQAPTPYTVTITAQTTASFPAQTITWTVSGTSDNPTESADFSCGRFPSGTVVFPENANASTNNIQTFTLPEVVMDALRENEERFQVTISPGNAANRVLSPYPRVETRITNVATLPKPDLNSDGEVDEDDALAMFFAYLLPTIGNGQAGSGDQNLRRQVLRDLATTDSDESRRDLLCKAISWQQIGRPVGGDLNSDGNIDGTDALVMYFAYTYENLVGNGDVDSGHQRLRELLLKGLLDRSPMTDSDYRALLRQANRLKGP